MHQRRIRLQAEHAAFPLWEASATEPPTDIDPRTLGLSEPTIDALLRWNDRYAELALEHSRASRADDWAAWNAEGRRLTHQLRTELGRNVTILSDL